MLRWYVVDVGLVVAIVDVVPGEAFLSGGARTASAVERAGQWIWVSHSRKAASRSSNDVPRTSRVAPSMSISVAIFASQPLLSRVEASRNEPDHHVALRAERSPGSSGVVSATAIRSHSTRGPVRLPSGDCFERGIRVDLTEVELPSDEPRSPRRATGTSGPSGSHRSKFVKCVISWAMVGVQCGSSGSTRSFAPRPARSSRECRGG